MPENVTTLDTIRELKHREPFVPFRIVMASGDRYQIDVLCNEIRGLGLNIQLEKKKGLGMEDEDGDLM